MNHRNRVMLDAMIKVGPTAIAKTLQITQTQVMNLYAGRTQPTEEELELLKSLIS